MHDIYQFILCKYYLRSGAFVLTMLAQLTLWKAISRYFNCVTFVVRMCRVVTCDCASWNVKYDVFHNCQIVHGPFLGISVTLLNKSRRATGMKFYPKYQSQPLYRLLILYVGKSIYKLSLIQVQIAAQADASLNTHTYIHTSLSVVYRYFFYLYIYLSAVSHRPALRVTPDYCGVRPHST
jgi:hypothetical protein